jgi:hypothetical protein
MEPVGMKLYELESEADRQREDAVRPGMPYEIAATKMAGLVGVSLEGTALQRAALVAHYGLALSWSPLYLLLRRTTSLGPVVAGLGTGAAMSAVADEWMTPAFGFSAPNCGASPRTWCSASVSPPPPKCSGRCADDGPDPHRPTALTPTGA